MNALSQRQAEDSSRGSKRGTVKQCPKEEVCSLSIGKTNQESAC